MNALVAACMLAACDLGSMFAEKSAWETSAVDFTVDHAPDGFQFASEKRDIVNCMKRGACTWHGVKVWEARIYFDSEGATKVEMSLYNKGDDKANEGLDADGFREMLAKVRGGMPSGAREGQQTKRKLRNGGFQHLLSWTRCEPEAELAWGTTGGGAKTREVDFVRLTLRRAAAAKPKGAQKSVSGMAAKAKVKANVTKNAEGDVWIKNVPMVDQGRKGYCAAAVAERVLRYYGNEIDEHQIAQMAGTTARGGTSVSDMLEAVRAVGSKCRLGFNSIVSMGGSLDEVEDEIARYNKAAKLAKEKELSLAAFTHGNMIDVSEMRRAMKPKVLKAMRMKDPKFKKFLAGVKTQVDMGVPVFWGVTLGYYPEPGLPQAVGGHMRLIIGYNPKTREVLYTDTWGAGHELKRMPEDWAFAITHDAFFLKPL